MWVRCRSEVRWGREDGLGAQGWFWTIVGEVGAGLTKALGRTGGSEAFRKEDGGEKERSLGYSEDVPREAYDGGERVRGLGREGDRLLVFLSPISDQSTEEVWPPVLLRGGWRWWKRGWLAHE